MNTLVKVPLKKIRIDEYEKFCLPVLFKEIKHLQKNLKNLKVININATASGGGVAEILKSLLPLMKNTEIDILWYTIPADTRFFSITKKLHNLLQGEEGSLTKEECKYYITKNENIRKELKKLQADILVVHDPQLLFSGATLFDKFKTVWHCHIDTSHVNKWARDFVLPYINSYSRTIFSLSVYALRGILSDRLLFFTPAIDPLSPKNISLEQNVAKSILEKFSINTGKPYIAQISRFDYWKDPMGVIDAYRMVKNKIPDLQLILAGPLPDDDPEGDKILQKIYKKIKNDPDIFVLSERDGANAIEINAFQLLASVVLQKSKREGFGLTVAEAMWKGKPVIGGDVGGIKKQIIDGYDGFLIKTTKECADLTLKLLKDHRLAKNIGDKARESVREKFLIPRLLRDYLLLFNELKG